MRKLIVLAAALVAMIATYAAAGFSLVPRLARSYAFTITLEVEQFAFFGYGRPEIDKAKRALGERGAVWWDDEAPDYNRRLVKNTPYAEWYEKLRANSKERGGRM